MTRGKKNGVPIGVVDREKISDTSITELENAVADINDKPTRNAVKKIIEVITGEEIEIK